ncbi:hypothetical protein DPQ25_12520 [Hydrogeniiclostridium mannosilyticum]|uniref:Uncharacterized protein n=1 Tax=Hydrogeniiclostridium mannosilyticum TaxID=2764322 RepID=A0A328UFB3_9FIRM|nr:hypothetical protein DPQ25_12520 [Hydrogeniiclostridium mannosilyticum]
MIHIAKGLVPSPRQPRNGGLLPVLGAAAVCPAWFSHPGMHCFLFYRIKRFSCKRQKASQERAWPRRTDPTGKKAGNFHSLK